MIVISGSDIRRYRRAIGWNQREFAARFGVSQSALSLLEADKIAVSDDHIKRLASVFATGVEPTFSAFLKQIEEDSAATQIALHAPGNRFTTLTVWRWEEGTDLGRRLPPTQADGLITIAATDHPTIAFRMPRKTSYWAANEVLVFEKCNTDEVRDGDICLVQTKAARGSGTRTAVAVAHIEPAKRGRVLGFKPISPAGSSFAAADPPLRAVLRAMFRGQSTAELRRE